jgi:DNA-binding MarR family transcriptional regulator
MTPMRQSDYARLLAFRTDLRRFLHWSEEQARAAGITPAQHQLLLAVKGHVGPAGPTIGEVADSLFARHHSVVELVDRAERSGYVRRVGDATDHRVVHLELTEQGEDLIRRLSKAHLEELERLGSLMR